MTRHLMLTISPLAREWDGEHGRKSDSAMEGGSMRETVQRAAIMEDANLRGLYAVAILLDVEKLFDSIDIEVSIA